MVDKNDLFIQSQGYSLLLSVDGDGVRASLLEQLGTTSKDIWHWRTWKGVRQNHIGLLGWTIQHMETDYYNRVDWL